MVLCPQSLGATAVINVRFDTNTTMNRLVFGMHCSVVCYGTAVRCRPLKDASGKVKTVTIAPAEPLAELGDDPKPASSTASSTASS